MSEENGSDVGFGPCLVCSQLESDRADKPLNRGLCGKHKQQWIRERNELADEDSQSAFDDQLIARGLLLPSKKPGRKKVPNPFREVAEEMKRAVRQRKENGPVQVTPLPDASPEEAKFTEDLNALLRNEPDINAPKEKRTGKTRGRHPKNGGANNPK